MIIIGWWEDYQYRRGQDRKTLYNNNLKNIISTEFKNSTSYELVQINNIDRGVRIVDENSVIKSPNKKRLLCYPDEIINIGDIVVYANAKWICTENDNTSNIKNIGIITRCTNILTFQLPNKSIHTSPCIFISPAISSTSKTEDNNLFEVNNGVVKIKVQNNQYTDTLENNRRLIFNNNAKSCYEITDIDVSSEIGLITLTIKKSQYNPAVDRLDLNVADYDSTPVIPDPIDELFITGKDSIYYTFSTNYEAKLYSGGELVVPQPAVITYSVDIPSLVTLTQVGNVLTIQANPISNGDYSNKTIVLTANDGTNIATKTITLRGA